MGRSEELTALETLYERVLEEGTAQLVTLIGEAGVGKSRVLREFESRLAEHPSAPSVRTGRCLPYGTGIVFWALGEVLRAEASIVDSDSADTAWTKLSGYVAELRGDDEGADRQAALIGRLLGVEVPPELVPREDDPERARESFFSALRSGIESIARRRPFVIAFEDIHWADDGMLEAIEHLAQWVRAPLLLVCLARDELLDRQPGWGGGRRSATQLLLNPLSEGQARELVQALLPSGREMVPAVAERSGGNPLFAEEMARRIAEKGGTEGGQLPDTVQGVLAARLDSLRPFERRLVQQASVAGRTFWEGSLVALARSEGQDLGRALADSSAEGHPGAGHGGAHRGRARVRVQARPDPRRGLRDAPEGGPLAEALRGGHLPRAAGGRPHRRGGRPPGGPLWARRGARPRGRRAGATS